MFTNDSQSGPEGQQTLLSMLCQENEEVYCPKDSLSSQRVRKPCQPTITRIDVGMSNIDDPFAPTVEFGRCQLPARKLRDYKLMQESCHGSPESHSDFNFMNAQGSTRGASHQDLSISASQREFSIE